MAQLRQNDDTVRTETVERTEHVWSGPPVVRGLTTLLCVALAGFLVWLASEFDLGSTPAVTVPRPTASTSGASVPPSSSAG